MTDYNHILLATDLSEKSDYVAEHAKKMAKESGAKLSIVYVMEHSPVAYGGEFSIPIDASLEEILEKQARDTLAKLSSKYEIDNAQQHLANGSVKMAVTETAEEIKADLIIVGTHSHHGLDVLLGSRANAILHRAKCDVLVVRIKD
jgi:universal stress protein A